MRKWTFAKILLTDAKKTWNEFKGNVQQIFNANIEELTKEEIAQKIGLVVVGTFRMFDVVSNVFYLLEGDVLTEKAIQNEVLRKKVKQIKNELSAFLFFVMKELKNIKYELSPKSRELLTNIIYDKKRISDITEDCQDKNVDLHGVIKSLAAKYFVSGQEATIGDLFALIFVEKYKVLAANLHSTGKWQKYIANVS